MVFLTCFLCICIIWTYIYLYLYRYVCMYKLCTLTCSIVNGTFCNKNYSFYSLWYVNLHLYMDLMEFEIDTIQFHMVFREFIEYTFQFPIEAVLHIINFILFWVMNTHNNDMKPVTSQYYIWHPISNKLITVDMIFLCTNKLVPNSWFSFPFPQKCVFSCWFNVTAFPSDLHSY
jgi:hypothetical protein